MMTRLRSRKLVVCGVFLFVSVVLYLRTDSSKKTEPSDETPRNKMKLKASATSEQLDDGSEEGTALTLEEYHAKVNDLIARDGVNTLIESFRPKINQSLVESNCQHNIPFHEPKTRICTYLNDGWGKNIAHQEITPDEKNTLSVMSRKILSRYPDAAFVDLGAFIGIYGLAAASLGRPVFAFEPVRTSGELLATSAAINMFSQFHLYPFALGKKQGCIYAREMEANHPAMTFVFEASCEGGGGGVGEPVTPQLTLDHFTRTLQAHGVSRAVVKIDVERHEPFVIAGAEGFLRAVDVPVVQMEWVHMRPSRQPDSPSDADIRAMIATLGALGYSPYSIRDPDFTRPLTSSYHSWGRDVYWVKSYPA